LNGKSSLADSDAETTRITTDQNYYQECMRGKGVYEYLLPENFDNDFFSCLGKHFQDF